MISGAYKELLTLSVTEKTLVEECVAVPAGRSTVDPVAEAEGVGAVEIDLRSDASSWKRLRQRVGERWEHPCIPGVIF